MASGVRLSSLIRSSAAMASRRSSWVTAAGLLSKQYLPAVKTLALRRGQQALPFHQFYQPTDAVQLPAQRRQLAAVMGCSEIVETQRGQQANQILLIHTRSRLLCHCHRPQYRQHRVIGRQIS